MYSHIIVNRKSNLRVHLEVLSEFHQVIISYNIKTTFNGHDYEFGKMCKRARSHGHLNVIKKLLR